MLFSSVEELKKRKEADLIVFPFWEGARAAKAAASLGTFAQLAKLPIESKDFVGNEGQTLLLYTKGNFEKRCLLLGLGKEEEVSIDKLRRSYASLARVCLQKNLKKINVVVPNIADLKGLSVEEALRGVSEGLLLSNYAWSLRSNPEKKLIHAATLIGILPEMLSIVQKYKKISEGVYLARDLINGNADEVTPAFLANVAQEMIKRHPHLKLEILDKKRLVKEKLGLLLAVGKGSSKEPLMIILSHEGNPRSKEHTVIVGKGITFDTGGLNLKPTGSMETMRDDMSGAATCIATIEDIALLNLPCNVTAVIPCAENSIDSNSFKPGDVYRSYNGKTVEIGNTDAEGRLILADALSYAVKNLHPSRMIDMATLTGSMVIALGDRIAGMFSNNDALSSQLIQAGEETAELLWRMPLFPPYREQLDSDIADIKNVGGRPAGSITSALFLQEFVGKIPWAHIDIAGPSFLTKEKGYWPKNGVGFGVRLFVQLLENLST